MMYEELCDARVDAHGEKESLFTDEAQAHPMVMLLALHVLSIFPLYWKNTVKDR